ncbi:MAG: ArsA-related P-loop ATPase [Pseudomonadota bacterium]
MINYNKKIYVCLGTGGVGKTTLSCALGYSIASLGKKVLVITVDPAKRLASSLGLESLSDSPKIIRRFTETNGELSALMPDTKTIFDKLVNKYAPNKNIATRIMSNQFYEHISTTLAGSHEYMCVEKLYEVISQNKYDTIILDTPPSNNVMAFLEAPKRMVDFCNDTIFKWFVRPYKIIGRSSFKLIKKSSDVAISLLQKLTGVEFLMDLSEFFFNFNEMYKGIRQRASDVNELIFSDDVTYFIVSGSDAEQLNETKRFINDLGKNKIKISGIFFNKIHNEFISKPQLELNGRAKKASSYMKKLIENYHFYEYIHSNSKNNIEKFLSQFDAEMPNMQIPYLDIDIHNEAGIEKLAEVIKI